jgi:hypothetical protein
MRVPLSQRKAQILKIMLLHTQKEREFLSSKEKAQILKNDAAAHKNNMNLFPPRK